MQEREAPRPTLLVDRQAAQGRTARATEPIKADQPLPLAPERECGPSGGWLRMATECYGLLRIASDCLGLRVRCGLRACHIGCEIRQVHPAGASRCIHPPHQSTAITPASKLRPEELTSCINASCVYRLLPRKKLVGCAAFFCFTRPYYYTISSLSVVRLAIVSLAV